MSFQVSGSSQLCRNRSLSSLATASNVISSVRTLTSFRLITGEKRQLLQIVTSKSVSLQIGLRPQSIWRNSLGKTTVVKEQVRTSGNSFWWTQPCIEDAARGPTSAPAAE